MKVIEDTHTRELDGLLAKEIDGNPTILPVWHSLKYADVKKYSPLLASRVAAKTEDGFRAVAMMIARVVYQTRPDHAPGHPIYSGRLTKRVLLSLPVGSVLSFRIFDPDLMPSVLEELGSEESRQELWRRLNKLRLQGRTCEAYRSAADYRERQNAISIWKVTEPE